MRAAVHRLGGHGLLFALVATLAACGSSDSGVQPSGRIAFVRDLGYDAPTDRYVNDLYVMNADGSDQRRIVRDASCPVWSPDGRWIAYVKSGRGPYDVHVVRADGHGDRRLTQSDWAVGVTWSSDGRWLFWDEDEDPGNTLFAVRPDGSGGRRVTPGDRLGAPSPSPGGNRLALSGFAEIGARFDVFVMNVDGTGIRNVTQGSAGENRETAWSPDGKSIAFMSDRDGNWDIYVMKPDGRNQRNLTRTDANEGSYHVNWKSPQLAWSPDGSKIVFESEGVRPELFVVDADGSNLRRLTDDDEFDDYSPSWSPDGELIAFVSDRDGNAEIYLMDADGSDQRNITTSPAGDSCPAWAPRG